MQSMGLIPGEGAKIPHASQPKNQNMKQKQYCNKFNKDFKNGLHQFWTELITQIRLPGLDSGAAIYYLCVLGQVTVLSLPQFLHL